MARISICITGTALLLLLSCSGRKPLDAETARIAPSVVWMSNAQQVWPDAVDSVRISIQSKDLSITESKTTAYAAGSIVFGALPKGVVIDIHLEGLDANGNVVYEGWERDVSLSSATVEVRIEAHDVSPLPPANAHAVATGPDRIKLTWRDMSSNEAGFIVERAESGQVYAPVDTLGADNTTCIDSGLSPETGYSYRIASYNAAGKSPQSALSDAAVTFAEGANSAPSFSAPTRKRLLADTALYAGVQYGRRLEASDIDGDTLVYSAGSPLILAAADSIAWLPASPGTYDVWVKVSDHTLSDSVGWRITVSAVSDTVDTTDTTGTSDTIVAVDTIPPQIALSSHSSLTDGDTIFSSYANFGTIKGFASDASGIDSISVMLDSVRTGSISDSVWSVADVVLDVFWHELTVWARDKADNDATKTFYLYYGPSLPGILPHIYMADKTMSSVTVAWNKTTNAEFYYVLRNPDGASKRDTLARIADTVFTDTTPVAGTVYEYRYVGANRKTSRLGSNYLKATANRAPVFAESFRISAATGTALTAYRDTVKATDPDGDSLTYSIMRSPSGMTINEKTGIIDWTPASTATDTVNVIAYDGYDGRDTTGWEIRIQ
jgi:hypothetical protein